MLNKGNQNQIFEMCLFIKCSIYSGDNLSGEEKARKMMSKLGLKQITGVSVSPSENPRIFCS